MKPREECNHPKLNFGSGDYYIFCHDCGAWWVCIDPATHRLAAELSNKGVGAQLSGVARSAAPPRPVNPHIPPDVMPTRPARPLPPLFPEWMPFALAAGVVFGIIALFWLVVK